MNKSKIIKYINRTLIAAFILCCPIFAISNSDSAVIFKDNCPFECCQFGEWIIKDEINVYQNEGDTSSILYKLNFNDTIVARTGNLHFVQLGKVIVLKQIYDFEPNDTLNAFNCVEGEFMVSLKGKQYYVDIFWPIFYNEKDNTEENYLKAIEQREYFGKMIQTPKVVWWVKINSPKGTGWLSLKNRTTYCFRIVEKIEGMDGCG